jgi:hypothetical protein
MEENVESFTVARKVAFVRHTKINVWPLICITLAFPSHCTSRVKYVERYNPLSSLVMISTISEGWRQSKDNVGPRQFN